MASDKMIQTGRICGKRNDRDFLCHARGTHRNCGQINISGMRSLSIARTNTMALSALKLLRHLPTPDAL